MSIQTEKPSRGKVKNLLCMVAICLMLPVIVINLILIFQAYILKEEVPDICGYYPLISLTDESSPRIKEGDLVFCRKVAPEGIKEGTLVSFFASGSRDTMYIHGVAAVHGERVTLRIPGGGKTLEYPADNVIGEFRFSIRYLGYIMAFLSTIPGFLLCVVIPTVVLTEFYLYKRRKDAATAEDEESVLLAQLKELKAEREELRMQLELQQIMEPAAGQTSSD